MNYSGQFAQEREKNEIRMSNDTGTWSPRRKTSGKKKKNELQTNDENIFGDHSEDELRVSAAMF